MNELQACVDHHVNEEEGEMFPRVELLMDAVRRDELANGMQARKREAAPAPRRATAARATRGRTAKLQTGRRRRSVGRKAPTAKRARTRTVARAKTRKRTKGARGRNRSRRAR
jgi:hypothetical protein